jgi:SAM-dependent methyltransferase
MRAPGGTPLASARALREMRQEDAPARDRDADRADNTRPMSPPEPRDTAPAPLSLTARLRAGQEVDDDEFDDLYPPGVRAISSVFWTPMSVAVRAAELLAWRPRARVLDVGSGVGKLCVIAAGVTNATYVGVEARASLVAVAEEASRRAEAERVRFIHGHFADLDVREFDALYFFNPFEEFLWPPDDRLDHEPGAGNERFVEDVTLTLHMLDRARVGTRVVTYHGFGGRMPDGYRLEHREWRRSSSLDLWVKTVDGRVGVAPVADALRRRLAARRAP